MSSLGLVRGPHLNPWDVGNYYGLTQLGVELHICGTSMCDWGKLLELYPRAKPVRYNYEWEVMDLQLDVLDVPDAHYEFSQFFAKRHPKTVITAWDNLPGKNTFRPNALAAMRQAWKFVARSSLAAQTLIFDGVDAEQIKIIPGAIEVDQFKPLGLKRENAVLFVGRLEPQKGIVDLIWAMSKLKIDAELWVAGPGGLSRFNQWIDRTGIRVKNLGFLDRKELIEVYNQVKVLCVPSFALWHDNPDYAWLEQFGQVFIEAMACGTPVVSTTSGAIPEVVKDDSLLVPPRNWQLLAQLLNNILTNRAWGKISESVRRTATTNYSQEVVARQIKDWYGL